MTDFEKQLTEIKNLSYIENGKRFAECVKCKNIWNISFGQYIPQNGYICPKCELNERKNACV